MPILYDETQTWADMIEQEKAEDRTHTPGPNVPRTATMPAENHVTIAGPLVRQPAPAARLAHILHNAATELWDVCTEQDAAQMYEDARAIASRILAACPLS